MKFSPRRFGIIAVVLCAAGFEVGRAAADVALPAIFTSHLVLQRDQKNPVWGRADAGEKVTVALGAQTHTTAADADGRWRVELDELPAGGPHQIVVAGKNRIVLEDCLVGEVWLCSGQSNMQMPVSGAFDPDLETRTARYPQIRLISVPQVGTQEPQFDFRGQWEACSPETVGKFTAVGYFFGRQLHQTLGVPVGLINVAWGGSACEAWINRDVMKKDGRFSELLARWEETEKNFDPQKAEAEHAVAMEKWKAAAVKAKKEGTQLPRPPKSADFVMTGNQRPANIYNGVLKPVMGYGIRGNIWYQGESNSGRAYQYRDLFPLMIDSWRKEWGRGDFSFYWVQLADFQNEEPQPGDSAWAELREAQTMTFDELPNVGQAVIIDIGEANDIHPRNKQDVAKRLARWALAKDYGIDVPFRSPTYKNMQIEGNRVTVTFDHVGGVLRAHDYADVRGFALLGEDDKWHWAEAKIVGADGVVVTSAEVNKPSAVRYGWATNPVCNLRSSNGLPVTPFRSDDRPGVTMNVNK